MCKDRLDKSVDSYLRLNKCREEQDKSLITGAVWISFNDINH